MKVLKLKSDYVIKNDYAVPPTSFTYKQGRLFVVHQGIPIALATPVEPTVYCGKWLMDEMQKKQLLDEVELTAERWVHPHLIKIVAKDFEKEKAAV